MALALAGVGCADTQPAPRAASSPAPPAAAAGATINDPRILEGQRQVVAFFGEPYLAPFDVRTFPDRASLDAFVSQRWKMPATQCWMVAMGAGPILVLLDPSAWKAQACEHDASDPRHVQQIVTHELVHVFHGQHCPQPEFDGMDDAGWFVEGLAIYGAGQLDAVRVEQARAAAASGLPPRLANAWSGTARYAISGSLVAFLDQSRGREAVKQLMTKTTNDQILAALGTTEGQLLADWRIWALARAPETGRQGP
jgi:hypothetical protein